MKKYLITGLVILLPLALTYAIVAFFFNLLTGPFIDFTKGVLTQYGLFQNGFGFLTGEQIQIHLSQLLIVLFLISITIFFGFVARWVFFHYLLRFGDYILHRIPLVNTIYKTSQDVIKTIFVTDTKAFKQVVMVPFPNEGSHCIGLVTREDMKTIDHNHRVAVFVPTTPNPTSGFLVMFKKEDIVYLDMKIEDALKYVISCGVILSPFQERSQVISEE